MSTRNLDKMMTPGSVVAIGASARPGSLGEAVTRNLLAGGFQGDIHLVNIKGGEIAGRPVLKSLAELKQPADLAVIMTPPETVPRLVLELGERGTRVAVVITAGSGEDNRAMAQAHPARRPAASAADRRTELHRLRRASHRPQRQLRAGPAQGRAHRRHRAVGRRAGRARRLGHRAEHRLLAPDLHGRHEPTSTSATSWTCWRATTTRAPC